MKYIPLLLLVACVPVSTPMSYSSKTLLTEDLNYEPLVGMVQVFPKLSNGEYNELEDAVIALQAQGDLQLKFDLLQENFIPLNARFVHCQADWALSNLPDIRFTDDYNEFPINDFEYSAGTQTAYITYSGSIPSPKIAGNYLLVVYRGYDKQDVLFSRRVLVFFQKIVIENTLRMSTSVSVRNLNHQIDFSVDYKNLSPTINPLRDFRVMILQNHNWATALADLQPTLIRQDESYLEYHHFNLENNFSAGNEFRFFDLRSIDYRGMNVANITKEMTPVQAFLRQDKDRSRESYSQLNRDINGSYYLDNTDPGDSPLHSEYVETHFQLLEDEIEGDVYVMGKFNNWRKDAANKLIYDPHSQSYRGKVLLKQGYYNYIYEVKAPSLPASYFEGNHFQTSNEYEILIYWRNPTTNIDELVGYRSFLSGL